MDDDRKKVPFTFFSALLACKRAKDAIQKAQGQLVQFSEKLQDASTETTEAMTRIERAIQDSANTPSAGALRSAGGRKKKRVARKAVTETS